MGKLIATTQATVDGVERDLLEGDLDDSIPKLKTEVDGDLFMHGSGEFSSALAERGLTDEYEVHVTRSSGVRETCTCSATGDPSDCGWRT
jgi:dihydrofolate reductase